MPQHLYLCGYRGTGKTSVAESLAPILGMPWVDLDVEIERAAGKTIREIFADGGEVGFRDQESDCLGRWAAEQSPSIVSLGGGAILRSSNRQQIAATGRCVWLTAATDTILARISSDATTGDRRPALTDRTQRDEIETMLAERAPLYRDAADCSVSTEGRTIEQVARQIADWWSAPEAGFCQD